VRTAIAEGWVLARILLRFVVAGILAWQGVAAASRGGAWYALAVALLVFAVFYAAMTVGVLWVWGRDLGRAEGHS
jgi:hypothetical protein